MRYKSKYKIPEDAMVTIDMVMRHWELEKSLASELRASNPANRQEVFERSYSTLYRELKWLNRLVDTVDQNAVQQVWRENARLIGQPPQRIYEVGAGRGETIRYLADLGFECHATEITCERGDANSPDKHGVVWTESDGVHLDRYELAGYYDVVFSGDVIEHIHPDDVVVHLAAAHHILRPGGRYILLTPHKFRGPSDMSSLFNVSEPQGMHLKEYTVSELVAAFRTAQFEHVAFPYAMFSRRYHRVLRGLADDEVRWISLLEMVLARVPRFIRGSLCQDRRIFPVRKICLIATK